MSNMYYNEGLEKAGVRDLSGAVVSLRHSLQFNKNNIKARNLLGLVYFEMGEAAAALRELKRGGRGPDARGGRKAAPER